MRKPIIWMERGFPYSDTPASFHTIGRQAFKRSVAAACNGLKNHRTEFSNAQGEISRAVLRFKTRTVAGYKQRYPMIKT